MKTQLLINALQTRTLIGIRTTMLEWGKRIIGFIDEVAGDYCVINEIDEYGFFIGKPHIHFGDIVNIDIDDPYQKRLMFLHRHKDAFDIDARLTIWEKGAKLIPYFDELIKSGSIVTLFFDEDDYLTGCLSEYSDEELVIDCVGSDGDEDGRSCYPIDKIIGLRYNGIEEQKIKLLRDNRAVFY